MKGKQVVSFLLPMVSSGHCLFLSISFSYYYICLEKKKIFATEEPEFKVNGGGMNNENTTTTTNGNDDDETTTMGSVLRPTDPHLAPNTYDDDIMTTSPIVVPTTPTTTTAPPTTTTTTNTTTTEFEQAAMVRMTASLSSEEDDDINNNNNNDANTTEQRSHFGPAGHWAHSVEERGIFNVVWCQGCCSIFFSSLFWMGMFATPCVLGQLMQRLGLSIGGMPTFDRDTGHRTASQGVCFSIFVLTTLVYVCVLVLDGWLVDVVWYILIFYCIFMGILLRSVIRQHFGIGPMSYWVTCWDGMLEDCLLATFCSVFDFS